MLRDSLTSQELRSRGAVPWNYMNNPSSGASGGDLSSIRLIARVALSHLMNHLGQFPLVGLK
ncbi:unnamed protein product [Protopolystoma xenopodis]|uniref:Uncharacterized protein n=1 Tax=Protopolystoma xenopodis TaxID=117903 RepID=A0A3S5FEC0_9PLAT|nr:unnamed protein product [Protopolystoma xenopodis]